MAQFDLHRNRGAQQRAIPYVVIIQLAQFDRYRRRVIAPLVKPNAFPSRASLSGTRMNPIFTIEDEDVVLHPLDTVSVAIDQLGERIGSLAEHGQRIVDAMDELLTRSWG